MTLAIGGLPETPSGVPDDKLTGMTRSSPHPTQPEHAGNAGGLSRFVSTAGYILGISYPLLALATGVRSIYQLFFKNGADGVLGPALSAVAAVVYLAAAVGFLRREKWAWWMSVFALSFETLMVVTVGTLSLIIPDVIGHTAWGYFGLDYGFFPLVQPVLGLIWLFWPETTRAYGVRR
jgi:hypothetical protein